MKKLVLTMSLVLMMATTAFAAAPITITIPFGAGGSSDATARIVVEYLKQDLGGRMMIVNKPGASGTIGTNNFISTKKPNGRDMLVLPTSVLVYPVLQGRKSIDSSKIVPVGGYIKSERILFAKMDAPYTNLEEMFDYARKNPGKLRFGTGGATDSGYVFKHILDKENLDINVTFFNGGGAAASAILGGHVDLIEGGVGSPADLAAMAGKLRPIGILSSGNIAKYPELKTPSQLGYDYEADMTYALFYPAGTDPKVISEMSEALQRVLKNPGLIEKFAARGAIPEFFTPEEVKEAIQRSVKVGELKALDKE